MSQGERGKDAVRRRGLEEEGAGNAHDRRNGTCWCSTVVRVVLCTCWAGRVGMGEGEVKHMREEEANVIKRGTEREGVNDVEAT